MRQVRQNVFETNSSSSHSLTTRIAISTEEDYEDFVNGDMFVDFNNNKMTADRECGYTYDQYQDLIRGREQPNGQTFDISHPLNNGTNLRVFGYSEYD